MMDRLIEASNNLISSGVHWMGEMRPFMDEFERELKKFLPKGFQLRRLVYHPSFESVLFDGKKFPRGVQNFRNVALLRLELTNQGVAEKDLPRLPDAPAG